MKKVFFDSDVFHLVGNIFVDVRLDESLSDHIALSPITLMEVVSKLTLEKNSQIFKQIQAIHNWMNPSHAELLPWVDAVIAGLVFEKDLHDPSFVEKIGILVNDCINSTDPEDFRRFAGPLKTELEKAKALQTERFKSLVERYRSAPWPPGYFEQVFAEGQASRIGLEFDPAFVPKVSFTLNAYQEYQQEQLSVAVENPFYNFEKHSNDVIDAEQLIYLALGDLIFVTADGGYLKRVVRSSQKDRIIRISHSDVSTVESFHDCLKRIIQ